MLGCASFAIIGIWLDAFLPEAWFKLMATLFIAGLASFLIWSPLVLYKFLKQRSN
jgi:hypothetical protein